MRKSKIYGRPTAVRTVHVSIRVNSATVMAWKVQDNKTNAVEEPRSTSTAVGDGGCVIYLPPLYCINRQEEAWLAEL